MRTCNLFICGGSSVLQCKICIVRQDHLHEKQRYYIVVSGKCWKATPVPDRHDIDAVLQATPITLDYSWPIFTAPGIARTPSSLKLEKLRLLQVGVFPCCPSGMRTASRATQRLKMRERGLEFDCISRSSSTSFCSSLLGF